MTSTNHTTSASLDQPVRFCRCCGEPCAVISQTDYRRDATGTLVLSTCVESSCDLVHQTLSDNADLRPYDVTAQYDGLTGALLPRYVRCSNVGPATREDRQFASLLRTGRAR